MRVVSATQGVLEELSRHRPRLHGREGGRSYGISREVLRYMAGIVREGSHSLETGCGLSTILFAASRSHHITISPEAGEHERVRAWCGEHGVPVDRVQFIAGDSRQVLPALKLEPLDLVLIDGCHAMPSPLIDWYYTAGSLKVGGIVIVDDTHIRSGGILRDFLAAESGRWALRREFRSTAVFEKLCEEVIDGIWWGLQPYCARTRRFRRVERFARPLYDAVFLRRRDR